MEKMEGYLNQEGEPSAQPGANGTADHYRSLFEFSPVSLWEQDYSQVKQYLETLRQQDIPNNDLFAYLQLHPEAVQECANRIRVINVNRKTLQLYGAASQEDLIANIGMIFCGDFHKHFTQDMVDLWNGKSAFERDGMQCSLAGTPIEVNYQWTALPGFEKTLARVLVSVTDITAHKKAERYLNYLGTHDVLTGLYNRAFLEEERSRLEESRRFPISIIISDLNGLKVINDQHGHAAGDDMLRRIAEVLKESFRVEDLVARIGGDEFAVLLPETNYSSAEKAVERLYRLIEINNTFYQGPALSLSIGAATGEKGASLNDIQREADDAMYHEKRMYYRRLKDSGAEID